MNTNQLTDRQKIDALVLQLKKIGFEVLSYSEVQELRKLNSFDLVPPLGRTPRPRQLILALKLNNKIILCLTTFLYSTDMFAGKGMAAAWILILNEHNVARHISRPIRRIGKFCNRIYYECNINKMRVEGGVCECGANMDIFWGNKYLRVRYFKCPNGSLHRDRGEKTPIKDFNYGVKGKYLEYVMKRTKRRQKYAVKRRAISKDPQHAMKHRKKWIRKPK